MIPNNSEKKKPVFKIKTRPGSQHGANGGIRNVPSLKQSRLNTSSSNLRKTTSKIEQAKSKINSDHVGEETIQNFEKLDGKLDEDNARNDENVTKLVAPQITIEKAETTGNSSFINQATQLKLEKVWAFEEGVEVFATRLSPDDSKLAIGVSDGYVHIRNLYKKANITTKFFTDCDMPVTHTRWLNNNQLYAANAEGFLVQYDTYHNETIFSMQEKDNQILAMDHSSVLNKVATGGKDCAIRLYDDSTKQVVRTYPKGDWYSPGHSNRIFCIKFKNDDNNVMLSGGWDGAVFIWDVREKKYQAAFAGPNVSGDSIDTKDNVILIGSHRAKESLELWDFGKQKRICPVDWNPSQKIENAYVYACQFSKVGQDQILAGAAVRNEVQIFNRNIIYSPLWTVKNFQKAIYSLDWGNMGEFVAMGGGEGKCYLFSRTTM